jgi:hypothetical protein
MFPVRTSTTEHLSLSAVIERLAARPEVEGLLTIGSTGPAAVTPASDYDLVVVLNSMPVPLHVALTYIDERLTDIIFVLAAELEGEAGQWGLSQLHRWLRGGHIVFDRAGRLAAAQTTAQATPEAAITDQEQYAAWFSANYNLQQTRRMLASDDLAYQIAVDLRLLFSLHDVWRHYFVARHLQLAGEKAQTNYLLAHDPAFLLAFQGCLQATDRLSKFQRYELLAAQALAPLGGRWPADVTAIMPDPDAPWSTDAPVIGLMFWQTLIGTGE